MRSRCKAGQSLIEVIVSVGIAVILAIALISAGLISNKTARSARTNTQATKLAEQEIEQIRVFRDRQGFGALTVGTCYTLNASGDPAIWSLSSAACPNGEPITLDSTVFSRMFSIADASTVTPPASKRLITVTVSWKDSGGTQTVTNQTIFSMWTSP